MLTFNLLKNITKLYKVSMLCYVFTNFRLSASLSFIREVLWRLRVFYAWRIRIRGWWHILKMAWFSKPILLGNHTQLCHFWMRLHIFMISVFFEQIVKNVRILTDFIYQCNWCKTWFLNAVWQEKERSLLVVQYSTEIELNVEEGK